MEVIEKQRWHAAAQGISNRRTAPPACSGRVRPLSKDRTKPVHHPAVRHNRYDWKNQRSAKRRERAGTTTYPR